MIYKQKQSESGVSTLVVVFVLAVVGVLTLAGFWIKSVIQTKLKIDAAQEDVADIVLTVRALAMKNKDLSMLSGIRTMEAGRTFLEKFRSTTTPFGKDSYYSVVYDPNYPDVFSIYIANISSMYCKALSVDVFSGAVGGGCGETYANMRFVQSQQQFGVGVAINTDAGLAKVEDRFGIFYKGS